MKKWFVIHPLLFAIFPILFLFSHNIKEMSFGDTIRSAVIVVSFTLLLWLLLTLVIKNLRKAGMITSIFLLLLFSHGHLFGFITTILRYVAYFHHLVFEKFPVLSLLSSGVKEMPLGEIVLSIATVASFAFLVWILINAFIKNRRKSAIITSILLLSIFCYGYFVKYVLDIFFHSRSREIHFVLLLASIFAANTFLVIKIRRKLYGLTNYLNIVSIFLVAFPMITIVVHRRALKGGRTPEIRVAAVDLEKSKKYPDIYYIILDSYARADILEEFYQYDNSEFLKFLTQKGFFVADKARSNYVLTSLSLASSLNFTYLNDLAEQVDPETDDELRRKMIWNSRVASFLKERGFLTVVFSSGVASTEIKNADIFITLPSFLSEFENLLLTTTPIPLLLDRLPVKSHYDLHRERLLYIFDNLAVGAKMDAPVFVFAHVMAPHPPFVFGQNGERVNPHRSFSFVDGIESMDKKDKYVEDYRNQLVFVNKKIQMAINKIISESPQPPIIILQADHGSGLYWGSFHENASKERISILNAYYLPGSGDKKLYDEITPVNTFRMIFNHYFGTDLELLEDKCYYSSWYEPYKFIDVTDITNTD